MQTSQVPRSNTARDEAARDAAHVSVQPPLLLCVNSGGGGLEGGGWQTDHRETGALRGFQGSYLLQG